MTRQRNIGRAAALGGLTATIALLTGLPAASADELADLRANQELLQRRIDQLAQAVPRAGGVPGAYGTQPIPGHVRRVADLHRVRHGGLHQFPLPDLTARIG